MSKILVTGGAGFVGSHLVDRLVGEGNSVVIIDNLSSGAKRNLNPKAKFIKMDIRSIQVAHVIRVENPEIVFHLAAKTDARESVEKPLQYAKTNIIGSMNLIDGFIKSNLFKKNPAGKKFIFFSTGGVMYGQASVIPTPERYPAQPLCPYGWSKLAVELYLEYSSKIFGLEYIALRPSNIYGPRQNSKGDSGAIAIFCDQLASGKIPRINGDGKQTRDYIYVSDVVSAAVMAMGKKARGPYNIGTGKETEVNVLLEKIKKALGSKVRETHGPQKSGEHRSGCLDCQRAEKELGWRPVYDLDTGLEATVARSGKSR